MTIIANLTDPVEIASFQKDFELLAEYMNYRRREADCANEWEKKELSPAYRAEIESTVAYYKGLADYIWKEKMPVWAKELLVREI